MRRTDNVRVSTLMFQFLSLKIYQKISLRKFPAVSYIYGATDPFIRDLIVVFIGPDKLEPLNDWSWACFTGIFFGFQHHYILQPVALWSQVNLNFMLCPALKDPFNGPYYRLCAIVHQTLCLLLLGKVYTVVVTWCLPKRKCQD